MNLWRTFRNLGFIEELQRQLAEKVHQIAAASTDRAETEIALENERVKRIGAEAIAAERLARIEFQNEEIHFLRQETSRVMQERLKSLDAVNQKLMEPRTEAPPPDLKQFQQQVQLNAGIQAISRIRAMNRDIDLQLVRKFYPSKAKPPDGIITNGPQPDAQPEAIA